MEWQRREQAKFIDSNVFKKQKWIFEIIVFWSVFQLYIASPRLAKTLDCGGLISIWASGFRILFAFYFKEKNNSISKQKKLITLLLRVMRPFKE